MAVVESFMVKSEYGLTAGKSFTLEAGTGESLLVKDIFIVNGDSDYYIISIDRDTVGFFRGEGHVLKSHLYPPRDADGVVNSSFSSIRSKTLLSLMVERGYFKGFPLAEGQKLIITPYPDTKKLGHVVVKYEKYDAGDIKKEDVNGSEAKEYIYIAYGRISEEVKNTGEYVYDVMINPEEFADFPYERECPAKTEIQLLGITGWEVISVADASNYTRTKFLKLFKGRKLLFDTEKKGLPLFQWYWSGMSGYVGGLGISVMGQYTPVDYRLPLIFDTPIKFSSGEELRIILEVEAEGNGNTISSDYTELGVILRVRTTE